MRSLRPRRRGQRGSVLITVALAMLLGVVLLEALVVGMQFYLRRELQKSVDMAALAGAQALHGDTCALALDTAVRNAMRNGVATPPVASCGTWRPDYSEAMHFRPANGNESEANAVHVVARSAPLLTLPGMRMGAVSAEAVATRHGASTAMFSVAATLLQVGSDGKVPGLLALLGVNLDATRVVGYQGLAKVPIRTSGLLRALGIDVPADVDVATLRTLLSARTPTLAEVLGAVSSVGAQQSIASLLGLNAGSLNLAVKLLSDDKGRGLFTIADAANGKAVLQSDVSALDLVSAALGVANSQRGVSVAGAALGANPVRVGIVEPPSIGIGGVGTTAYSAQIRLYTRLGSDTVKTPAGLSTALLVGTLDLPIAIDLVDAKAQLTQLCSERGTGAAPTASFTVDAPMARLCVGTMDPNALFSQRSDCSTVLGKQTLLSLLNNSIALNGTIALTPLPNSGTARLHVGESATLSSNALALGSTAQALGSALANALDMSIADRLVNAGSGATRPSDAAPLARALLTTANNVLSPATSLVSSSLSTLQALSKSIDATVTALLSAEPTGTLAAVNALGNSAGALLNAVTGLLNGVLGGLLDPILGVNPCTGINPDKLACLQSLFPNPADRTSVVLGLVSSVLSPGLDQLGALLGKQLDALFGARLGQADVHLIALDCIGGDVRLVH